jgi:glycosyltransferase involved in cell wall biosynthesis
MRLLYLCDADSGGIAEYAVWQINALTESGVAVTVVCRPGFPAERVKAAAVKPILPASESRRETLLVRIWRKIGDLRVMARVVCGVAREGEYDGLLMASFAEYFSPLWAGIYRRVGRLMPIGTVAHDPVRDFVFGPLWWHRMSVRQGYSFVKHVFAHDETPVDFGGPVPPGIGIHVIPHGPYRVAVSRRTRAELRERWGFGDSDEVFLSFGQIRDGKNLDRFLRAMTKLPGNVKLLVAGSSGGGSQRPPEEYRRMAGELGLAERCVWDVRYVPGEEVGELFEGADYGLMKYSANFRSASGVLNTAVACRRRVLASSGSGPLKHAVEAYGLGVFVSPDDDEAILEGARRLLGAEDGADWGRYERENSWEENARGIIQAFGG